MALSTSTGTPGARDARAARRTLLHLRLGWAGLLLFGLLGTVLEGLHAFKLGYYLDVGNEARRLSFRLGHAHGALLALVHLGFAVTLERLRAPSGAGARLASLGLVVASVLLPAGFLLGGLGAVGGDPGAWIALVPAGASVLLAAVLLVLLGLR
jgi:hypothetical protein